MTKLIVLAATLAMSGCAAFNEHRTGVVDGRLSECLQWPRCVNSDSDNPDKTIPPLKITGDTDTAWQIAQKTVTDMPRTKVVTMRQDYIHVEVTSPWNFYTDDLELLLRPSEKIIAVRSSGRIGYYDFHVNRDRVEALRAELIKQGVVAPLPPHAANHLLP